MGSRFRRLLAVVVPAVVTGAVVVTGVSPAAAADTAVRPASWASVDRQAPGAVVVDSVGDAALGARAYFTFDLSPP